MFYNSSRIWGKFSGRLSSGAKGSLSDFKRASELLVLDSVSWVSSLEKGPDAPFRVLGE